MSNIRLTVQHLVHDKHLTVNISISLWSQMDEKEVIKVLIKE